MNDFEKMSLMSKKDQDIKMFGTLDGFNSGKKKSTVTIQIDHDTAQMRMGQIARNQPMTHYVALYVINKEQFDKIK